MKNIQSAAHVKIAKAYSFFSSMEEMDQHVTGHMETLKNKTTERSILQFLAQHSLTYPGTSWVKVKNIAASVGRCIRTVNYALTSLENKNIIQRVPVMREKKGGNSSNIIAILPFAAALHDVNIPSDRTPNTPDTPDPKPASSIDEPTDTNLQKFTRLIQYKWKDNIARHGPSYMEKVVNTVIDEYEKMQYAKSQREKRKQSANINIPTYDWLNDIDYSNFKSRTAWMT